MPLSVSATFAIAFARDFAWLPATTDLYVTTRGADRIVKLDWTTAIVTPGPAGLASHIVFDGTNFWVDDSPAVLDPNVYAYSPAFALVATVNSGCAGPDSVTFDGTDIFAGTPNCDSIAKMNTGGLIGTFSNRGGPPVEKMGNLVSALGDIWYVAPNVGSAFYSFQNLFGAVNVALTDTNGPGALCFDGANFWYCDNTAHALVKLSPAGAVLATYPVIGAPSLQSIIYDSGSGFLWLTTSGAVESLQVWTLAGVVLENCSLTGFNPGPVHIAAGIPFVTAEALGFQGILEFNFVPPATGGKFVGTFVGILTAGNIAGGTR
jgi:hypothetical protein